MFKEKGTLNGISCLSSASFYVFHYNQNLLGLVTWLPE